MRDAETFAGLIVLLVLGGMTLVLVWMVVGMLAW